MTRIIFSLLVVAVCLTSCDKNGDLTPNPAFVAEADNQASNDNNNNKGDDGEEDEGNNDSTSTQLHFRADINGTSTSFPTTDLYTANMSGTVQVQIFGRKNNNNGFEKVSIYIVNEDIIEGDTLYFDGSGADTRGEYFTDDGTYLYTFHSDNGYVVFNRVTSLQYGATFKFKATNARSTSDSSVYITNGAFLINRY